MRTRYNLTRALFILPSVLVVFVLLLYPVLSSIYFSFTNKNLLRPSHTAVGLENYTDLLTNPQFWQAFQFSVKWTIASIIGQLALGFLAALAIDRIPRFSGTFRTLLIIPWAFPPIIIAFAWKWILNDVHGFLPNALRELGISESNISLFADPNFVFWTVLLINIWFGMPLFMVNILSALKTIPAEQQEAARVDGASSAQRFRFITVPHIKRVIGLLVILRIIWVFNNFELVFLLTGGGPGTMTTTLPIFAYRTGWGLHQLGMASSITVLLLIFLLGLAFFAFKLINKWDRESH